MDSSSLSTFFRPWNYAFSKKKILFSTPFIFIFLIYAKMIFRLFERSTPMGWVFLYFTGFFISSLALSFLSLCINRIYYKEIKDQQCLFFEIARQSCSFFFDTKLIWLFTLVGCLGISILYSCYLILQFMPLGGLISVLCTVIPLFVSFFIIMSAIALVIFLFSIPPLHQDVGTLTAQNIKEYLLSLLKKEWPFYIYFGSALISLLLGGFMSYVLLHIAHFLLSNSMTLWTHLFQDLCIIASCALLTAPFFHLFCHYSMEAYQYSKKKALE